MLITFWIWLQHISVQWRTLLIFVVGSNFCGGFSREGAWAVSKYIGRGRFCSLKMCDSQAYVWTVCPIKLLLSSEFLEIPSSWNKSTTFLCKHYYLFWFPITSSSCFFFLCIFIHNEQYFLLPWKKGHQSLRFHRETTEGKDKHLLL